MHDFKKKQNKQIKTNKSPPYKAAKYTFNFKWTDTKHQHCVLVYSQFKAALSSSDGPSSVHLDN